MFDKFNGSGLEDTELTSMEQRRQWNKSAHEHPIKHTIYSLMNKQQMTLSFWVDSMCRGKKKSIETKKMFWFRNYISFIELQLFIPSFNIDIVSQSTKKTEYELINCCVACFFGLNIWGIWMCFCVLRRNHKRTVKLIYFHLKQSFFLWIRRKSVRCLCKSSECE